MKKGILAVMALAFTMALNSCAAGAYEEELLYDIQATEGDDEDVTPPPPLPG